VDTSVIFTIFKNDVGLINMYFKKYIYIYIYSDWIDTVITFLTIFFLMYLCICLASRAHAHGEIFYEGANYICLR